MQSTDISNEDKLAVDGRTKRRVDNGQRLLDAAIELMEDKPYQEISVEDICDAAGVGASDLFRAFKSKSGLIVEYNRRLAQEVRQQLSILDPSDAIQSLRIVGSVFANYYAATSPGLVNMAIDSIRNPETANQEDVTSELIDILDRIVQKGVEEKSITSELPTKLTAYVVLSHLGAAANYWFLSQACDEHKAGDIQQMTKMRSKVGCTVRLPPGRVLNTYRVI